MRVPIIYHTIFWLFCSLFVSTSALANGQLHAVLARHALSLGNLAAWKSVNSVSYLLTIKEPTFEVEAVYRATRDGKMRIDIYAQGHRVFTEGYNGKVGWEWSPKTQGPRILDETKAAALRHGIELPGHIFTLLDMQQNGHRIEYIGSEVRDGNNADVIKLTLKDGHEKYYVLDKKSGRIVASRDQRAFHPSLDETEVMVESRPSDYREIAGMVRSFASNSYDLTNNKWLAHSQVKQIKFDESIAAGYFEPGGRTSIGFADE